MAASRTLLLRFWSFSAACQKENVSTDQPKNKQTNKSNAEPGSHSSLGCGFPQHLATKRALGGKQLVQKGKGWGSTTRMAVLFLGMMLGDGR